MIKKDVKLSKQNVKGSISLTLPAEVARNENLQTGQTITVLQNEAQPDLILLVPSNSEIQKDTDSFFMANLAKKLAANP